MCECIGEHKQNTIAGSSRLTTELAGTRVFPVFRRTEDHTHIPIHTANERCCMQFHTLTQTHDACTHMYNVWLRRKKNLILGNYNSRPFHHAHDVTFVIIKDRWDSRDGWSPGSIKWQRVKRTERRGKDCIHMYKNKYCTEVNKNFLVLHSRIFFFTTHTTLFTRKFNTRSKIVTSFCLVILSIHFLTWASIQRYFFFKEMWGINLSIDSQALVNWEIPYFNCFISLITDYRRIYNFFWSCGISRKLSMNQN